MRAAILIFIAFSLLSRTTTAQDITIINQYPDSTGPGNHEDFVLEKSTRHVLVINYYKPASNDQSARLQKLVGDALNFYLDQCVTYKDGEIELLKNRNTILRELDQIVEDAGKYYQFKINGSFRGFSEEVDDLIKEIDGKEFEDSQFYAEDLSAKKQDFRAGQFFNEELNSLKRLVNKEIGNLQNEQLMVLSGSKSESIDSEELIAEIDSFRKNDPLAPIEMEFSDATVTLLASEDNWTLPGDDAPVEKAVKDEDFAEQVFRLLEKNEEKLDQLQREIDQLKNQREIESPLAKPDLQQQVDELRNLVVKVLNNERPTDGEVKKVATYNLPNAVNIYFGMGSTGLDIASQYKLNEIIELLGHNPTFKLVITGYADKTGNVASNLKLSQARSRTVKNYIAQSGIEPSRLIVNFFGDQNSSTTNPKDRKVVVEFVPL
jgi:outer membrane protein OmpA-like peptidoglycan-associated protein